MCLFGCGIRNLVVKAHHSFFLAVSCHELWKSSLPSRPLYLNPKWSLVDRPPRTLVSSSWGNNISDQEWIKYNPLMIMSQNKCKLCTVWVFCLIYCKFNRFVYLSRKYAMTACWLCVHCSSPLTSSVILACL